jgi:hypothetical protein
VPQASVYPLVTNPTGLETYLGVSEAGGVVKRFPRPREQSWRLFDTRALAAAAAIDAAAKVVHTGGYASVGDGGHALYKRLQSAPASPANPAYFRSADIYRADGTPDSINGGYWQLVPTGGKVHIANFGGKNDSDVGGVIGTDNLSAINYAMQFVAWQESADTKFIWEIHFDPGHYRFSNTIEVRTICSFVGATSGRATNNSTNFHWPANTIFMMFQAYDSTGRSAVGTNSGEATGSGMRNISVRGKTSSTDHSLCGISVRCVVNFKSIGYYYVAGNALEIKAGSTWSGGTNSAYFFDTFVHSCSRDAIWVNGGDANVMTFEHIDIHGPGAPDGDSGPISGGVWGCGIYDASYFGNLYKGVHIAGYGNHGVQYGGRQFYFIGNPELGVGEATTPGTNNDIWYDVGPLASPTTRFPAWSATPAVPYRLQIPIWTNGSACTFQAVYVEAQVAPCHGPGATTSRGGIAWWSRQSNGIQGGGDLLGVMASGGFSGRQEWNAGEANNVWNGESMYAGVGTRAAIDINKGIGILVHARDVAGENNVQWTYRYYDKDLRYSFGDPNNDTGWVWNITTPITDRTFGRTVTQPYVFNPDKLALGAGAGARRIGLHSDWATTPPGEHAEGELILNGQALLGPYKNFLGWRCIATGNPGTLAELRAACLSATVASAGLPTVAAGAVSSIFTQTVTGAETGDPVDVTVSVDTQGLILHGWVSAADTVKYQFANPTAGSISPGISAVFIRVRK